MLKVKIYNEGNLVVFRVLEQSEMIRAQHSDERLTYEASNGIRIISGGEPDLDDFSLYLRGNVRRYDDNVACLSWVTEQEAQQFVIQALQALQEFKNNNYFGEQEKKPPQNNTYIF